MKNNIVILLVFVIIHVVFTFFIDNTLDPVSYSPHNPFITNLLEINFAWPEVVLYIFSIINLILLFLISKFLFTKNFSYIPSSIYAVSPWGAYLVAASSFYIYLLTLILIVFYGLLLIKENQKKRIGKFLLIVATSIAFYDSFLILVTLSAIFLWMIFAKLIEVKQLKIPFIYVLILLLPLIFIIIKTPKNLSNVISSEVRLFSDPGLLNMVNAYQGAAKDNGFGILGKVSENKYIFFSEYIVFKYAKALMPATFFTSQEKLLGFSFTSPMFLGFLIPFALGFYFVITNPLLRKYLMLSTILVLPAVLSKQLVDLNRLVIFFPVIVFIVSFGLVLLYQQEKKICKFFLTLTILLVLFQSVLTVLDIKNREKERFYKTFGQSYDLGKQ